MSTWCHLSQKSDYLKGIVNSITKLLLEFIADILDCLRVLRKQFLLSYMLLSLMFYIVLNAVAMEIDKNKHRVLGVKLLTNLLC